MTSDELILINSDKVRRDSSLMAFYIETFYQTFGYKPNCAGCSFSTDWNKLKVALLKGEKTLTLTSNKKTMSTYKLKKIQNKIFAYRKDKKTFRAYDNNFTEDFVNNFLTHGTKSEIEDRKKLFAVLPEKFQPKVKADIVIKKGANEVTEEIAIEVPMVKKRRTNKPKK